MTKEQNDRRSGTMAQARAARRAVMATFGINGLALSSWFPHIPAVQRKLELSDGTLGVALLGTAVGALVATTASGWVIARVGSRLTTQVAVLALCASLPLPGLAPNLVLLVLSLVLLGAANGVLDVAMNTQAVAVEKRYRRPIMSTFHGVFSLGGLASSGLAVVIVGSGVGTVTHLTFAGLVLGIAAFVATRWLLPDEGTRDGAHGPIFARPSGPLIALGVVAFCVLLGEGAMADWSAVYLRNSLGTSAVYAAAGYAVFSSTMALGRLTGDRLTADFGPETLVRAGGAVVAIGLGLALILGRPAAALIGFACVGAGLSFMFPIVLSAAGRVRGVAPGLALAAVTSVGYTGFLAGPPLIGLVAQVTSLRIALGIVAALGALITALAPAVRGDGEALSPG
ncbi:MAG TPA: MFS transporter [Thermomicrobiales bacterium]|nr:MFS transporter [Thermomicrobiales bacterium]